MARNSLPRRKPKLKNQVNRNLWTYADEHRITMKDLARRSGVNRGYLVRARRRGGNWQLLDLYAVCTEMGQSINSVFETQEVES